VDAGNAVYKTRRLGEEIYFLGILLASESEPYQFRKQIFYDDGNDLMNESLSLDNGYTLSLNARENTVCTIHAKKYDESQRNY